jgi:hypothetical protein
MSIHGGELGNIVSNSYTPRLHEQELSGEAWRSNHVVQLHLLGLIFW